MHGRARSGREWGEDPGTSTAHHTTTHHMLPHCKHIQPYTPPPPPEANIHGRSTPPQQPPLPPAPLPATHPCSGSQALNPKSQNPTPLI